MFSIILPVYNTEKYLAECLESIINQTYSDLEIIIVNDGSPGNADEICAEFVKKDLRIKYFKKENGGVATARNYGITKATGEYIYCLDSDDTIEPQFIEKIYNSFEQNNSDFVVVGTLTNPIKDLKIQGALPNCAFSVRKSFLDKYSDVRFEEGIQPCEDGLFSHKLIALTTKTSSCPEAVYHYRIHDQSSEQTLNTEKILKSIPMWLERLEEFYNKYNLWEEKKLHILGFIQNEPFELRFCGMPFSKSQKKYLFNLLHKFIDKHDLMTAEGIELFDKEYLMFLRSKSYFTYRLKCFVKKYYRRFIKN